jgi:hypothetical protein
MSDNFSQKIISQLDKGISPIEIAEYFGGVNEFLKRISKFPYLKALVDTKLGGELEFDTDVDDFFKKYKVPVQITEIEKADDFYEMYDIYVDVVIPEVTDKSDIAILFNYLDHLEPDYADDWAYFNDMKFNSDTMTHVVSINGINWKDMDRFVNTTVKEVERIIPDKYEI